MVLCGAWQHDPSSNSLATPLQIIRCEHGAIPTDKVFGAGAQGLVARLNTEGQHRGAVAAAKSLEEEAAAAAAGAAAGAEGEAKVGSLQ